MAIRWPIPRTSAISSTRVGLGCCVGSGRLPGSAGRLNTALNLEQYASNLAGRGGVPWAVLQAKVNLVGNQARDTQTAWVNAAARRDGAPAVIGNAFDLKPLTISPRDMALLELREFDERRITAAFGVPGFLVNVATADSHDLQQRHPGLPRSLEQHVEAAGPDDHASHGLRGCCPEVAGWKFEPRPLHPASVGRACCRLHGVVQHGRSGNR